MVWNEDIAWYGMELLTVYRGLPQGRRGPLVVVCRSLVCPVSRSPVPIPPSLWTAPPHASTGGGATR